MKKMTGAEYKLFVSADWDAILGVTEAYSDSAILTVDGIDYSHSDIDLIPDDAVVLLEGGAVYANEDVNISVERFYLRWKKLQTSSFFTVQIINGDVDRFKYFVKEVKGKIL